LPKFSPGAVLELEALRASFEAGDSEFDFLMGDQRYKFTWATHIRWIGPVGVEPRVDRLSRAARTKVGVALRGKPGANFARQAAFRLSRVRLRRP
jgi:CelD/BcsL family acetyltransferase involved in cellulose biosynthesis